MNDGSSVVYLCLYNPLPTTHMLMLHSVQYDISYIFFSQSVSQLVLLIKSEWKERSYLIIHNIFIFIQKKSVSGSILKINGIPKNINLTNS